MLKNIFKYLKIGFDESNFHHKAILRGRFISAALAIRWKRVMKKFGPNLYAIYTRKIMHKLTYFGVSSYEHLAIKSSKVLVDFVRDKLAYERLIEKMRGFYN